MQNGKQQCSLIKCIYATVYNNNSIETTGNYNAIGTGNYSAIAHMVNENVI